MFAEEAGIRLPVFCIKNEMAELSLSL